MQTNCESCEYYDLDEDEMVRFLTGQNKGCPYYKYYDEYKLVQKQN